jgi:hypothetical protein
MKKIITILVLCTLTVGVMAQGNWSKFGKITRGTPATELVKGLDGNSVDWYFQPAINFSAIKWDFSKEEKTFKPSPFTAAGVGIGIQHYATVNEKLTPDYGFDLLVMLNGSEVTGKTGFGLAGTVNVLGLAGLGGGYDFTNKHAYLLTGVQITF